MNAANSLRRLVRPLWLFAFALFVAVALFPLSNLLTRALGLLLFAAVWFGMIGLGWRRPILRCGLLSFTALCFGFAMLPARRLPPVEALRSDYVQGLRRYEGVRYFWGGESPVGVDCSGLIRRGLIDSLILRSLRTADPGLLRRAVVLWWRDCTARALGEAENGWTAPKLAAESVNQLDERELRPGDLAVTRNGIHVMAYLGDAVWIEADPGARRVITARAPVERNAWFDCPVRVVRWNILSE